MTIKTIRTSAGDFRIRTDETATDHDIALKIARKLGYRAARATNSSGSRNSWEALLGYNVGSGLNVHKTVTVYR
jgi:hypothetical protein